MIRILPLIFLLGCAHAQQVDYDHLVDQAQTVSDAIAEVAPAIRQGCAVAPGPTCQHAQKVYKSAKVASKVLARAVQLYPLGAEQLERVFSKAELAIQEVRAAAAALEDL